MMIKVLIITLFTPLFILVFMILHSKREPVSIKSSCAFLIDICVIALEEGSMPSAEHA
jgi:hypothetical protein